MSQLLNGIVLSVITFAIAPLMAQTTSAKPQVFEPGVISVGTYDTSAEFTPDGNTVYFLRGAPDFTFWTIYESHRINGKWSTPQVAPFSGQYSDADPCITADNQHMYFVSNRPISRGGTPKDDMDIWVMERQRDGSWGEPRHLNINGDKDEWFPRLTSNGTLYFGSERPGGQGGSDIWKARPNADGTFQQPENLGHEINSAENEYEPSVAPDESYMYLMANKKEGLGRGDIYFSRNVNGHWTKPVNLGAPINSPGYEFAPKFTPDGKYFIWGSARNTNFPPKAKMTTEQSERALHSPGNGLGAIYIIDVSALPAGPVK
jgi:Tol biopolymer transport system component